VRLLERPRQRICLLIALAEQGASSIDERSRLVPRSAAVVCLVGNLAQLI
jgi:hypothetical protein